MGGGGGGSLVVILYELEVHPRSEISVMIY